MTVEFKTLKEAEEAIKALSPALQAKILQKAYELSYEGLDDNVYRIMATAIKHAKDNELEGNEEFEIKREDLKRLSGIQDKHRHEDKLISKKKK